ncbi:hypothetical protein ABXR98_17075 [Snodgrassella alvi]|uniref:Uncharacterized protein n=1 Tax=Snodgrassella alvi TaxID=1196083 RepID=A0A2N9Y3A7_9NEIS|nr:MULTISPECIES: hypothetical protein [Snodgrassella]NUF77794.1 hypothetical protein [Snodgrassella sp. ESL0323]PIT61944.1 hypothetical protein BHC47_05465 [Snodgrassella alvi]PIT62585.1 hypothetical protein BHC56_07090 [Snodgrassella alvi]
MKQIDDFGLGTIEFVNYGCDLLLQLTSVYHEGAEMGKVICKDVKFISFSNFDLEKDEGFGCRYIPSMFIKKLDNIRLEEPFKTGRSVIYTDIAEEKIAAYEINLETGDFEGRIICLEIILDIKDKYKNILIEV